MNTLPPGHALVHIELKPEGVNDVVQCEARGRGGDIMLCVGRLLLGMANETGVPGIFMAAEAIRIAMERPSHTSVDLAAIEKARAKGYQVSGDGSEEGAQG